MPEKAPHAGKAHGDTTAFDDYTTHLSAKYSVRLAKLQVCHDGQFVLGIQAFYEADGVLISGGAHFGTTIGPTAVNQEITFQPGEVITAVGGGAGDIVDRLSITTSLGQTYNFGGSGGTPFNLGITPGKAPIAFYGGTGGHLHNIGIYSR